MNVTTESGNQTCDGSTLLTYAPQPDTAYDVVYANLTGTQRPTCTSIRRVTLERIGDGAVAGATSCWTWRVDGANNILPAGQDMLFTAQSTVDTDSAFNMQKIATDMSHMIDALDARIFEQMQQKLDIMTRAAENGITLEEAVGLDPPQLVLADVLRNLSVALNVTSLSAAIIPVTDPDAVLAALRNVIDQTEIDRLVNTTMATSNLNALVQAIRIEEAQNLLTAPDMYASAVTAPLSAVRDLLSSDRFRQMAAVMVETLAQRPVNWECMARLEEAAARGVEISSGLNERLRRLAESVVRQDEACRPAFHNFWMFGVVDHPASHSSVDGMQAPETIHYTGPFCSLGGKIGMAFMWMFVWFVLNLVAYSLLVRLFRKIHTPTSHFYSPWIVSLSPYQYCLDSSAYQRAVYTRFVGTSYSPRPESPHAPSPESMEHAPLVTPDPPTHIFSELGRRRKTLLHDELP
jgi:hypothetical protein